MQFTEVAPGVAVAAPSTLNSTVGGPPPVAAGPATLPAATRLSLGGIKKKSADGKAAKNYPTYPADEPTRDVVDWLIDHMPVPDQVDTTKKNLVGAVTPFYFQSAQGRDPESSVIVPGKKLGEILVVFPKQLVGAASEEVLRPLLGARLEQFFTPTFEIKVDGSKVPAAHAQDLINELVALFDRYGSGDALTASEKLVPLEVFHLTRHRALSLEENLALDSKFRIKASVKVRK